MWLSLENLLREKLSNDSILLAWLIPHAACSLTKFRVKNDQENRIFACCWKGLHESAIETHQDQGPSGHRRVHLTIKIAMRIGATSGCSGCAGSRSHMEVCRVRPGKTLADERESETSRPVGAGIGSIAKMTVALQQPTAVMQQEPSSSPSSGPTTPMQEPTQNIQNEQMDSLMEMGAQEHREQRGVRLNETLSSELSKRPVVKAKPAHSPTIAPMMESLGLIVLLDPAPASKDETTIGNLHAIDGIDVVAAGCVAVRGDENVRERNSVSRRRTGISCAVDREDPSVSKIINAYEARTGEKLDSEEMQKRKAKEVQEFDEFEVRMEVDKSEIRMTPGKKAWSKWVETQKDPNKPWYELSGLSPREGSTQPKSRTMCGKRCGWSNGHFGPQPRQRSLQRVLLANASFADLKA